MADVDLPGLLVCQETLQPLSIVPEGLWSESASRLYPVTGGLVYMGYPQRDTVLIESTMQEEHEWQGTVDSLERDAEFLRMSAPRAVMFINRMREFAPPPARVLELGCGSGWFSWLLARAGYDMHLCDFEANSLTLGMGLTHPNIGEGRRIVADARYAPFADGTFDVVVMKEFVHHVEDFEALFREAGRVLRDGGVLAVMEPTMSVLKWLYTWRHPDPHEGHRLTWARRYLRTLGELGLEPVYVGAIYDNRVPRNPLVRAVNRIARRRAARSGGRIDLLGRLHLDALGSGNLVVFAAKRRTLAPPARLPMVTIDPQTMTTRGGDTALYTDRLRPILEEAAAGIAP